MALLEAGEKVHVIIRRGFDGDLRRHFLGRIAATEGTLARIDGYSFLYDRGTTQYVRHDELRTTVVDLAHPALVVNVIDPESDIEAARYEMDEGGRLVVTDGGRLRLDINEFGLHR